MFEARSTRFLKALSLALFLGLALGVVAMNLFDPARTARLEMLERDHARMQRRIEREARDNTLREAELEGLKSGGHAWRDVARREGGLLLEGEVVFRFPVSPP